MLDDDEDATELAGWVERTVGGTVTRVERVPRWRPAWDVDVEVDGRSLLLHVCGEREPRIVMPYRIADEVPVHDLLEAHGLPVPHAYGLCDNPYALVMDRLPGLVDLSFATDDDEREHLVDDYLELLAVDLRDPAGGGGGRRLRDPRRFRHHRPLVPPADGRALRPVDRRSPARPDRDVPPPLVGGERPATPPCRGAVHHVRLVPVHVRRRPDHRPARLRARGRRRPDDGPRRGRGSGTRSRTSATSPRPAPATRRRRVSSSTTTSSTTTPSCTTRSRSSRWARRWPIRCAGPIGCRTLRGT